MPMMSRQGTSGCSAMNGSETWFAASPKVCSEYATALQVRLSSRKRLRPKPRMNSSASRTSSSMSSTSTRSSRCIELLHVLKHVSLQPRAELLRVDQIDAPATKELLELVVDLVDPLALEVVQELDDDIDVAGGAEVVAQYRAEERQALDGAPAADGFKH